MDSKYTNGFNCAMKEDKSEMIIAFLKNCPKINEEGNFEGNLCENVSTVIMNVDTAKRLADAIYELFNEEIEEKDAV